MMTLDCQGQGALQGITIVARPVITTKSAENLRYGVLL